MNNVDISEQNGLVQIEDINAKRVTLCSGMFMKVNTVESYVKRALLLFQSWTLQFQEKPEYACLCNLNSGVYP